MATKRRLDSDRHVPLRRSPPLWTIILFTIFQAVISIDINNYPHVANLYAPAKDIAVTGPSHFPKPTRKIDENATIIVEPTFGRHRHDQDAILAYAEGYQLSYYMMFMETLTATGYTGDVVLAIAESRLVRPGVTDYLQLFSHGDHDKPNAVVYQVPLDCDNRDDSTSTLRRPTRAGDLDIFQMCRLSHIYGWKEDNGNSKNINDSKILGTAPDPREGRVVATLRYEFYWMWSLRYASHSWLMLLDARDSYFQSNPFQSVPREDNVDPSRKDGLLYLFGENAEATRLGKSTKNRKWLLNGYGETTMKALADKPTICSGSTMGEQIAIETYLRSMVNEHDECDIKMTGSDQGFHNYLYYSGKLAQAETIRRIVVWEQGRGMINNLGALRTKSLDEWGIYNKSTHEIYQWDGSLSPVVHQWDRDHDLHAYMWGKKHKEWRLQWEARQHEGENKEAVAENEEEEEEEEEVEEA